MTEKQFKAIAEIINNNFKGHGLTIPINVRDGLIEDFIKYFKTQNTMFNRDKFLTVCGVKE